MSVFDLHFNRDDVLLRNIIIGVLASLNERVKWTNRTGNDEIAEIDVPFYYTIAGQERFLQDNFLNDVPRDSEGNFAETAYMPVPRAIAEMGGISIMQDSLINKYVRGEYTKELSDGSLKTYSAEFISIPLLVSFEISVICDNHLDQFKAVESIIKTLYKNNVFNIDVSGIRIPGVYKIPEDFSQERLIEFGFSEKKEYQVKFSIDVEVSYPIFKNSDNGYTGAKDTERFKGNRMFNMSMYNRWGATAGEISSTGSTATSGTFISNNIQDTSMTSNQNPKDLNPFKSNDPWPIGKTGSLPPKS